MNPIAQKKKQLPSKTTFNAPLTQVQYQQTFDVKPQANVINIFTGNIDEYIKQIAIQQMQTHSQ